MVEQAPHLNGKERLGEILKTASYYDIGYEVKQPKAMLELLGEREYVADIQASKEGRTYIFEIDGIKNHSTKRNIAKDKARDRAIFAIGKPTIRIPTRYLVGKGKLTDREILEEIAYQNEQYNMPLLLTENKTT